MYREQRIVTACRVEFPRLDQVVAAESEDLSRHGVFVRTEDLLPVGDVVELSIWLPDDTRVRVISRVAHLLAPSAARALGRRPGMGFHFLEHDNVGREQLLRYLEDVIEEVTPPPRNLPQSFRILAVDASPRLCERVVNALVGHGFAVDTAATGAEAYSICLERAPDMVLTSVELPVMDGWTLIRMLRGRPRLADIPIVVTAEDASDMTRLRAYRIGVRDFLPKPFTDEELCIRVRRVALQERASGETVVLRGNTAQIGVPTLLSLLEFERKSGILVLLREDEAARLFVASGRIVKVEGPRDDGEARERLMGVLDWVDGNFEFVACEVVGADEVGAPTTTLLLEHARLRDETDREQ